MATFNPPPELLRRQLDSIREQTHGNWVCLISDESSDPALREGLAREIEGDARFVLSTADRHSGYYGNFERALSMAPARAEFVTLCDQDDRWHSEKLERLLEAMGGGAQLVYSDARVVGPDGDLVHDSYWTVRRNNYTNFGSLLLANTVTGAASLVRRDLLDDVLPFPPNLANPFHDHWLAVVAMARGEIAYVDEPLYDYVQHGGAVIGHSTANKRPRPIRQHVMERLRKPGTGSRVVYYYNWHQQLLFAEVLRLRCWDRMTAPKRRTLRRLLNADSGVLGLSWLLGRRVRRLWGRNETLDRELFYAYALVRRRAVSILNLGRRRPGRWLPRDASIPPTPDRGGGT
jgi:glycosyltransferase involved in cell wall biosynthesis